MHRHRLNRRNKILFLENIEMYLSAGLALHIALGAVGSAYKKRQQIMIMSVRTDIEKGNLFSKSLDRHYNFTPSIIGLIEQGERSGNMSHALNLARKIIEKEDFLIKTCTGALAYPIIIFIFAVVLTLCLMRGVMPQITPLLRSLHVSLPLITRIMMYISEHIVLYGFQGLIGLSLCALFFVYVYRKWYQFRRLSHKIMMYLPFLGSLIRYYSLSLSLRSLGSLVSSGMNIVDSYIHAIKNIPLIPLKELFMHQTKSLSQGSSLFLIFSKVKNMPPYVSPLIGAGEASGTLGASLVRSADILDRDIEQGLKRLTALIEPVMMIGIGCIVGSIALSIMMPIYDVSKALQH
jgi:type II secretory pathway component PulF